MDLQHEFEVSAGIDQAWPAFLDMPRLAPLMPGAEVTEVIDDRNVKGGAKVKVGPINLRFAGTATITDVDDDAHAALLLAKGSDAKGRGNANADVRFSLTELDADRTHVEVATELNLTGSVAQYGRASGLIDEIAAQLIGEFVQNLEAELATDLPIVETTAVEASPVAEVTADEPAPAEAVSGLKLLVKALVASMAGTLKKLFSRSGAGS